MHYEQEETNPARYFESRIQVLDSIYKLLIQVINSDNTLEKLKGMVKKFCEIG